MDYKYQVCPVLLKLCKKSATLYFHAKLRRVKIRQIVMSQIVIIKIIFNATPLYFHKLKNNNLSQKFVKKGRVGFDWNIDFVTKRFHGFFLHTGKKLSDVLIYLSINPKYSILLLGRFTLITHENYISNTLTLHTVFPHIVSSLE